MKKAGVIALIKKLGGKVAAKITPDDAKEQISNMLEKEGVPEDANLSKEEIAYIDTLGFEIQTVEEKPSKKSKKKSGKKEKKDKPEKTSKKEKSATKDKDKKSKKTEKKTGGRAEKRTAFINCIVKFINGAKKGRTREEIVSQVKKELPDFAKNTVLAYLSTGKNPKLCRFEKVMVEDGNKRLSFKK